MTRDSRLPLVVAAALAVIVSVLQLIDRDVLRGIAGLTIAVTMGAIAAGLPERGRNGKWVVYGLLAVVFVLLAMRMFNAVAPAA